MIRIRRRLPFNNPLALLLIASCATGLPSLADQAIYVNSLENGWQNWSWAAVNLNNSSPTHSANRSISVDADAWEGLSFWHSAQNANAFSTLSFWIHGGSSGGQPLQIYAETSGGSFPAVGLPALVAGTWQQVTIPLTSLGVAASTDFTRFTIQNISANTIPRFYVDDITLNSDTTPPVVQSISPAAGTLSDLTSVAVTFSEPVTGIDAADFLVNGNPAQFMVGSGPSYTFSFLQPPEGIVAISWIASHGITDFAAPGNPFNATGPGATWQYNVVDSISPAVAELFPSGGAVLAALSQIEVVFSETVLGLDAADLLVNGAPATNMSFAAGRYTFKFPPPPPGTVSVAWATGHGITDTAAAHNPFGGGSWSYTLNTNLTLPDVVINEFLSSSVSTNGLTDEEGAREDWIEIYNRGSSPVDLANWALSDDPALPGLWPFPARTLNPGDYLLVFASGKDRRPTSGELHTNFKLAAGGEPLGLYSADSPRQLVDGFSSFPEQRNDISYGLDLLGVLRYFDTPTPGNANGQSSILGVVEPLHANVSRGHFITPFSLQLSCPTPGAILRYTTDGSEPTASSPVFPAGLIVSNTTLLRAAGFKLNHLPSKTLTHSYLFDLPEETRSLPILSLVTSTNHLFGTNGIMGIQGGTYNSEVWQPTGPGDFHNPSKHGLAWEKPVSAEWIEPGDGSGFQVDCGIRVQGSDYNRQRLSPTSKYSFRLYFRSDYGPGRLEYLLFPGTAVTEFDQLVLRAGFNEQENPFIRDELHRRLSADMGQPAAHGNMAIVLVNGVYYTNAAMPWILPVYNPAERIHEKFFQSYLGGSDDWDVVKPPWQVGGGAVDGTFDDMQALVNYVDNSANVNNPSDYATIAAWMDLTNFVDYLVLNTYAGMGDWPANNWRAGRDITPGSAWRFVLWDAEWGMGIYDRSPFSINSFTDTGAGLGNSGAEIARLYRSLQDSTEFRLLWADRVQKHFFNEGALAGANITNRFNELRDELAPLIPSMNVSILEWVRDRWPTYVSQMNSEGLLSSVSAPGFNQFGGRVPPGFKLVITNTAGSIYYTTNGSDPRTAFSGAVSPSAQLFSGSVALNNTVTIRARAISSGNWSAITEATFTVGALGIPLRITELMYNPPGGSLHEFIELQNVSGAAVDLSGIYFDGINFTFNQGTVLAANTRLVLGANTDTNSWKAQYPGVNPIGWFAGNLSNGGERISLFDSSGKLITSLDYSDSDGWPTAADGGGRSLEILDPNGDPDDPANWQASTISNGTPGAANSAPLAQLIYLNELMADNSSAVNNGGTFPDWVELRNPGGTPVNLMGWSLTDDGDSRKFIFPNTTLPAFGYLTIWCDATTNITSGLHTGFSLDKDGDKVFLYDANTNRIDALSFGLLPPDMSVGRINGGWTINSPTPNAPNVAGTLASASKIAINEWMANPVSGAPDWLELFNKSFTDAVSLQGIYLSTSNGLHQLNSLAFLAPRGYLQLFADEGVGPDHLDFKLPASGGIITVSDATGAAIEYVSYVAQAEGVSQGRIPDGGSSLFSFDGSVSPETTNYLSTYSGPVINEVLARNKSIDVDGVVADYVELYNPNASAFNLAGMSLSVNSLQAGEWTFPPGASIAANGYLTIRCDGGSATSTNIGMFNTAESLDGESGGVFLFNTNHQLVNSVEYGLQVTDLPIGLSNGQWQLLSSATPGFPNSAAIALGHSTALRINEWMAKPQSGADWFELFNTTNRPVDLGTVSLSDDPSVVGQGKFLPAPLSFVGANGHVKWIADSDVGEGRNHVNFALDGEGDSLLVYSRTGGNYILLTSVGFGAETSGVSRGCLPDGTNNIIAFPGTASPGESNYRFLTNVCINEALTHTDPPLEDAIEFYNPTATPVNIGGWFLSNNRSERRKYQLPGGTTIPANGYLVIYEYQFNNGTTNAFTLNSAHGDEIWLSEATANLESGQRAGTTFGAAFNGVSFGRIETSSGVDFFPLTQRTFGMDTPSDLVQFRMGTGLPNAAPVIGPIVINEILYHPPGGTNGSNEFIELFNNSGGTIALYDPAYPTNHWKLSGGIDFIFPANESIAAGGYLLVVDFDPADTATLAAFRARYNISVGIPVYGPFEGSLDNAADHVELYRPDTPQPASHPDAGFVPCVLSDRVSYTDALPWPIGDVDGGGLSLQRTAPFAYGNEALHWTGATPTPGRQNSSALDTDGDGIPDDAENQMGLNPNDPTDAAEDDDEDGMNNLQEYLAGTDHKDPNSNLRFSRIAVGNEVTLTFAGISNRTYSVLFKDNLADANWAKLSDVAAVTTNGLRSVSDSSAGGVTRFYRLVTPMLP